MIDPERQKKEFNERLRRISAGGENTMGQIYVGPVDEIAARKKKSGRVAAGLPSLRQTVGYPASIVAAFLLGMLAVLITRYLRFSIAGSSITGEDADITMAIDAGLALAIGFVLKQIFRLSGKVHETSKTFGIFAMICVMHNLVHTWPGAFEIAFSPEWVTEVIETTEPNSILFRGVSFVVGEGADQKTKAPTVFRVD